MKTNNFILRVVLATLLFTALLNGYAQQIPLTVTMSTPLFQVDQKYIAYLKVDLRGLPLKKHVQRTPLNLAFLLDYSNSMSGKKIQQAKKAITMALDYIQPDDIVSIISYNDDVTVLMPATKVTDRNSINVTIAQLTPSGHTALYPAIQTAVKETQKFLDTNHINRIILLSDGMANVGPTSLKEFSELVTQLTEQNISITTLGFGIDYKEELMNLLAENSHGNHAFIENIPGLKKIFTQEFGSLPTVVVQHVEVTILCAAGVRPVRLLGRKAKIEEQQVITQVEQLYPEQEKYILLEIEISKDKVNSKDEIAVVTANYKDE